eukprot:CAMPEP_0184485560 /NCGR_PEP_ID=MMETSP0113_2-20130426/7143_1 /TAXON_ID=91329 /ORGANISM="Norrisiella sphaerica, Strain BC52" /LENGTH=153 /DNA_ID=CAMNT_0026867053 /DNA_START=194 /DNA_END=655 /DNA_ORIENTATION=+
MPSFPPKAFRSIERKNTANIRRTQSRANQLTDVVGSFMDITAFVSDEGAQQARSQYGELADAIGRDVYIDINGWHLYWRDVSIAKDVKLSELVAQSLGPRLKRVQSSDVDELLGKIPLTMGGGKTQVPLLSVTPQYCVRSLHDIIENAAKDAY